jgi:DNA-binding NtrC family response regulator
MTTLNPANPIVLVDDESDALLGMRMTLQSAQFSNIACYANGNDALRAIEDNGADLVVLDLLMPGLSGDMMLKELKRTHPFIPVIMATGVNEVGTAVSCIKNGAADYIVKPIDANDFVCRVRTILKIGELEEENRRLKEGFFSSEIRNPAAFEPIVTRSPKMLSLFRYIEAVAKTDCPILITGETGVGKELIARAIHDVSDCCGNFIAVNVAGLDDNIFSDTLFGHVKGAFTGADQSRPGLVERAAKGTLFLDEIGDLSHASQVKLLRLIQEKEYIPLGADMPKACKARIVTATCNSVDELNNSERFRRDLLYRLNTHHVHIPPLRERLEDIELLTEYFVKASAVTMNREAPPISRELYLSFKRHPFEGNIRELKSLIFDAMSIQSGSLLTPSFMKDKLKNSKDASYANYPDLDSLFLNMETLPSLKTVQQGLIVEALRRSDGVHVVAAGLLGITPQALGQRIKKREM